MKVSEEFLRRYLSGGNASSDEADQVAFADRLKLRVATASASDDDLKLLGPELVEEIKTDPDVLQFRCTLEAAREKADGIRPELRERDFVMSTEKPDQGVGDILRGWDLKQFRRNPIALFMHRMSQAIGTWKSVRRGMVDGFKSLEGTLKFASEGASPDADMAWNLVQDGVLKAASVGVRILATKDVTDEERQELGLGRWGVLSMKTRLMECSLVSIPMHGDALGKSMEAMLSDGDVGKADAERFLKSMEPSDGDYAEIVRELTKEFFAGASFDLGTSVPGVTETFGNIATPFQVHTFGTSPQPDLAPLIEGIGDLTQKVGEFAESVSELVGVIADGEGTKETTSSTKGSGPAREPEEPHEAASAEATERLSKALDQLTQRIKGVAS